VRLKSSIRPPRRIPPFRPVEEDGQAEVVGAQLDRPLPADQRPQRADRARPGGGLFTLPERGRVGGVAHVNFFESI
jgi:hypothetical protein